MTNEKYVDNWFRDAFLQVDGAVSHRKLVRPRHVIEAVIHAALVEGLGLVHVLQARNLKVEHRLGWKDQPCARCQTELGSQERSDVTIAGAITNSGAPLGTIVCELKWLKKTGGAGIICDIARLSAQLASSFAQHVYVVVGWEGKDTKRPDCLPDQATNQCEVDLSSYSDALFPIGQDKKTRHARVDKCPKVVVVEHIVSAAHALSTVLDGEGDVGTWELGVWRIHSPKEVYEPTSGLCPA